MELVARACALACPDSPESGSSQSSASSVPERGQELRRHSAVADVDATLRHNQSQAGSVAANSFGAMSVGANSMGAISIGAASSVGGRSVGAGSGFSGRSTGPRFAGSFRSISQTTHQPDPPGGVAGWGHILALMSGQPEDGAGSEASASVATISSDDTAWDRGSRRGDRDGNGGADWSKRPGPSSSGHGASDGSGSARSDISGVVPLSELQLQHDDQGRPRCLGAGNFGAVYKAVLRGEEVAVKVFEIGRQEKQEVAARQEVKMLKSLEHPNVVGYRGACLEARGHLLLVMELLVGDLRAALSEDMSGELRWRRSGTSGGRPAPGLGKEIALDIAKGLAFLHDHQVVHLDLKSPNVLLTPERRAKIADVGLARLMPNDYLTAQAVVGTFVWSAPEVLMGGKCSTKVDVYSLGVILHELITGEAPKRGRMRPLKVPEDCPQGVANLVDACTAAKPVHRPTAQQVADLLGGSEHALNNFGTTPAPAAVPAAPARSVSQGDYALRRRMANMYDNIARVAFGSDEAAAAAGYIPANVETVVQDLRPADALWHAEITRQIRPLLEDPEVEDPRSPSRQRIEFLWGLFRELYIFKIESGARVFNSMRNIDLIKLQSIVSNELQGSAGGLSLDDIDEQDRLAGKGVDSATARLDTPATREKWAAVLDAAQLSQEQEDAFVEARRVANEEMAELREERRQLMRQLRGMAAVGASTGEGLDAGARLHANIATENLILNRFQVKILRDVYTPLQHLRAEIAARPGLQDAMPISDELLRRREAAAAAAAGTETTSDRADASQSPIRQERHAGHE